MSKIIAVSMMKDEADIAATTIKNLYDQVDHMLVADNGSTDGTAGLLAHFETSHEGPGKFWTLNDPEVAYYQSRKMSELAERAVLHFDASPGDWIVPFDADEMWMGVSGLRDLADEVRAVKFPGVDYRVTASSKPFGDRDPVEYMTWHEPINTGFEPKIAFRYAEGAVLDMGNHGVLIDGQRPSFIIQPEMYIGHFPIRSLVQFIRKVRNGAAAYAATDYPAPIGQHWRRWGEMRDDELREEFFRVFFYEDPAAAGLEFNPLVA
jgi:hypothetical protein